MTLRAPPAQPPADPSPARPPAPPGFSQPIGALLLLRAPDLRVVAGSANLDGLLGRPLSFILGRRVAEVLPPALAVRLPAALAALQQEPDESVALGWLPLGSPEGWLTAQLHGRSGVLYLELECGGNAAVADLGEPRAGAGEREALRWLRLYQQALAQAQTLQELAAAVQARLQALTGYAQVALLQVDAAGALRPLIEPATPGLWEPLAAGDLQRATERADLLRAGGRVYAVADVEAADVPLLWAAGETATALPDLHSVLAAAPELLRRALLGVGRAGLLLTLGDGRRPRGALLAIHPRPRWPSPQVRELCALAGAQLQARLEQLPLDRASALASAQLAAPARESSLRSAEPAAQSLSLLAGGFAHDLNNLLTGVLSSVSLVRTAQLAGQTTEPYLEQIETAVLCAGDLCRQVLAYAGRGSLVIERVNLSQLVAQTLPLLQLSLGGRARLKLQLLDTLPLVLADATQLRQVLLNLVTNGVEAIGAARQQGGELTITTSVVELDADSLRCGYASAEAMPGPHVALRVRDNGVGMEAAVLERAFEPFFTTKPSGSPAGRGLGLAIVLGVVKGHRGVLQVRSSVGQGTDFMLLFPCASAPAEPPAKTAGEGPGPLATTAAEHTILVVDDETTVREFIARVLRTAGYRVLPVGTGEEALALCRSTETRLSLALIDWSLHRQQGESIVRQLHRLRSALPLVILSGYGPSEYIKQLSGLPIAGTLQKPFRLETLLRLVQRVVARAIP